MQKERSKFTRLPFKKFDYGQQDFSNKPADFSDRFSEKDLAFIMGSMELKRNKRV